ncbi:ATP-dependent Clp protease ATP-binding subunit [uncultured Spirosoma sp.]|uniref:ATP-dependent Clp protease ATP-binding subunit n=1 Tax=uncultured Spirosoma sp. TaxID=278208 RepID=UPI00258E6610|nr:ATP-dependent Clp protease ATP-binding subunit [uncultured Spirosoma sp.]
MLLSETSRRAVQIAQSIAKEGQHAHFAPAHLMLGLLHNDVTLASWLTALGKDVYYMRDWAEIRLDDLPRSGRPTELMAGDEQVQATVKLAELIALQLSAISVEPAHLLAALLKANVAFSTDQLKSLPVSQKEILDAAVDEQAVIDAIMPGKREESITPTSDIGTASTNPGDGQKAALYRFCSDKTALASEGKLDPIIGRDRELRLMLEILGRRTKPNVMLVGEPGVGKTALIEGFAQAIVAGKVPAGLQNASLFELDLGALVAGAAYKGEVEDRIKGIIREIKAFDKAILFIDEVHVLLNPNGSVGTGVSQLLKPELARGELTVIGATTNDEFRQYIEKDEAFSRRFERLIIPEPDVITATRMVANLLPLFEQHHGIKTEPGVAEEAVRLASRYVKDRRLPDAAVDLLDRTMAAIRTTSDIGPAEIQALTEQLGALPAQITEHGKPGQLAEYKWLLRQFQNRISPILRQQIEDETPPEQIEDSSALHDYLTDRLARLTTLAETKQEAVTRQDVAAMISAKTGIPLGKLQSSERDKLNKMEDVLRRRVVGQDHAVKSLAASILESRAGLTGGKQPTGAFFLLGPTGTGKTELAKSLADFLFNNESFLIRFDMSEFKEEHSAALLYGAPPGYVGYEQGGLLVNKIREKPYSVVLFDEIEKAHPSVFDIFLQILDEGKLHDRLGKEGDFSNAVVLFTSNIGSEFIVREFGEGRIPAANDLMDLMARHFRPEFLARLTEIVPFAPISEENAVRIFNIHLRDLEELLTKQGITLVLTDDAREQLALGGFSPRYGARPLKGVIRSQLRRPISKMIIAGELGKGDTLTIDTNEGKELSWRVEREAEEPVSQPA